MFENAIKKLQELERGAKVRIDIPLDQKGCMDRRCPSKECGRHFKIVFADWRDKVPNERAFCPHCRLEADPKQWNTDEQSEYIRAVGLAHIKGIVDRAFESDARQHNMRESSRPRNGLINISMTMAYKPSPRPVIVPLTVEEALRQDFVCESCACRWSSLGSTFFCPACGHNSAAVMFDRTLVTVRRMTSQLETMTEGLEDRDAAEDATRQIMEDQLGRLVGAFERFSEALADTLPSAQQSTKKGNLFQRIDDASAWWHQAVGSGYDAWLQPSELARLKVLYQRRHLLVHRQGIVDQQYLDRTGDVAYQLGQRVTVRGVDVAELTDLLQRLAGSLRGAVLARSAQVIVPPASGATAASP
ncbi:MAG: hypothetical protein ACREJO_18230 [Phycisphaerales bacterium]